MTRIGVSCPDCGTQVLSPDQIKARVCRGTSRGSFRAICPECKLPFEEHQVTLQQFEELLAAGVLLEEWSLPAELREPHPTARAFIPEDLITLHRLLEEREEPFFRAMKATVRG